MYDPGPGGLHHAPLLPDPVPGRVHLIILCNFNGLVHLEGGGVQRVYKAYTGTNRMIHYG